MSLFELSDWTGVKLFLAVAHGGSYAAAARILAIDQATVGRRVAALETQLGAKLFDRHYRGMRLSPAGRLILPIAERMEDLVFDIERGAAGIDQEMRGNVTITATEGLGAFWLTPRMLAFQRQNPGLAIRVEVTNEPRDLAAREADIAIRYEAPRIAAYVRRHVGYQRLVPFASRTYLREFGTPLTMADLSGHQFVHFETDYPGKLWQVWRQILDDSKGVTFASNSAWAIAHAIREGYGIGLMPAYAAAEEATLVELPIEIGPPITIWVLSHEETNRSRRVRATLNYIYRLFEVDQYRYFAPGDGAPAGSN